jgi:hypothetical protein
MASLVKRHTGRVTGKWKKTMHSQRSTHFHQLGSIHPHGTEEQNGKSCQKEKQQHHHSGAKRQVPDVQH